MLTIFNLGYFQAKVLNGVQEEEGQHTNCMDLAIKNSGVAVIDLVIRS